MGGDATKGYVTETVPLYTLPAGKQFLSFEFDPHAFVDYQDTNTSIDFPSFSGGDFIEKIQVMGDGQGNDFNCDGDKDAHVKIFFKPFNILVKPN
jgi:hypothetical protein